MKNVWFSLSGMGGCVCSTLMLMWQAAGSESSVAPLVLKTILLILKGKPGTMEDRKTERRHFSLDTTNMMPVAVNNTMSVSFSWCCFLSRENPYLLAVWVILPWHNLALIHSLNTYLLNAYYMSHLDHEAYILVRDTDNEPKKCVMCQMIQSLEEI